MKGTKWLRKSLIVLVSVLTFGFVTPADFAWLAEADSGKHPKKDALEESKVIGEYEVDEAYNGSAYEYVSREDILHHLKTKAEDYSYTKFGEKISPKIHDEFQQIILPKIEEAIAELVQQYPEEELKQLLISGSASYGRGEKIFHIYNEQTGKDIIRFHVRQENPPQEGYWFNFHYHTYHDEFLFHHDLGRIYWDKNTPPKWSGELKQ